MIGFSHIGLATFKPEATRKFYEDILGLKKVVQSMSKIKSGGVIEELYFQLTDTQYIVFMSAKNVHGIPESFDTGINSGLGLPKGLYHFSFAVESVEKLTVWRERLEKAGIEVSEIIDLDTVKSIFFFDPNGIQLEMSVKVRNFDSRDLERYQEVELGDS